MIGFIIGFILGAIFGLTIMACIKVGGEYKEDRRN